jgi:hypothetical protein
MAVEPSIFVPTGRGRAAVAELDRVAWRGLAHAYTGAEGTSLFYDVGASLARLGDTDPNAAEDAFHALFGNVYHQGTIYEVTAHAVPFVAAFAAGPEVWIGHARDAACLLGSIAIASSFATTDGTMSGSFGEGVAETTREALRTVVPLLAAMAELHASLSPIVEPIRDLVHASRPKRHHLDAVAEQVDALQALEVGDPPFEPPKLAGDEWVAHAKLGVGLVLRREDDKVRVRFADGSERLLAARFVTKADPPA